MDKTSKKKTSKKKTSKKKTSKKKTSKKTLARPTSLNDKTHYIVGIGASAGGLEALELFFKTVPAKSAMAFVVVQHLDPTRKDMMVELLQRTTSLPVSQITDPTKTQPGHVYVIPPNRDLSILHGVLHLLEPAAPRGLRLPIDFFFRALSEDQGERSIGVILSGMGSDGTLGLRAIKEKAGAVFVQNPDTAKFDGMPRSVIDARLADVIASAEELPEQIDNYLQHVPLLLNSSDNMQVDSNQSTLDKVVLILRAQTGHDFSFYKKSTIYRRIERRMGLHQLAKIADYVRYLRENSNEAELLFKELLIGVTSFFRDTPAWEKLKSKVMPALFANYPEGGTLRVWCTACSTGEEAYSLAITFSEALEKLTLGNSSSVHYDLQIFATDLDRDAIDKARVAVYLESIAADVSEERLNRYFIQDDRGYRLKKEIRDMVIFAPQNLVMDPPFTKIDLVSCRNLLIYLEPELQNKILTLFHYSTNPNGFLMLGNSETTGQTNNLYTALPGKTRIYKRRSIERQDNLFDFPSAFHSKLTEDKLTTAVAPRPSVANLESLTNTVMMQYFSPPAVLTTKDGDIVYISGKTGKYLEPATGKANLNIFAMARDGLVGALNAAFNKAVRNNTTISLKNISVGTNGGTQNIEVTIRPLSEPAALRNMVLIVFTDIETPSTAEQQKKTRSSKKESARLVSLSEELQQSHEDLQTTREEMQSSQEELKSTNEELQSTNEELQSTNEELTTSKEEMQSMNEEMQTVNHELVAKVSELELTSDDMNNLLNSTEIATLFLDSQLKVRRFTLQTTDIIKLIAGDAGRPITDLVTTLDYPSMADDAHEVVKTLTLKQSQVRNKDGRWFEIKILPYRTQTNHIDGVVITFNEITKTKELEFTLREAQEVLQSRYNAQGKELDTANALELVLNKAQSVLEQRIIVQGGELKQSKEDLKQSKDKK